MKPYWLAYLIGGNYRWGWRPSLYQHIRKYYREDWRAAGYTLTDWLLQRPPKYFRPGGDGFSAEGASLAARLKNSRRSS